MPRVVWVYEWPRAAITNDPELGGLAPREFIASQFWRPESEIRVSAGL